MIIDSIIGLLLRHVCHSVTVGEQKTNNWKGKDYRTIRSSEKQSNNRFSFNKHSALNILNDAQVLFSKKIRKWQVQRITVNRQTRIDLQFTRFTRKYFNFSL